MDLRGYWLEAVHFTLSDRLVKRLSFWIAGFFITGLDIGGFLPIGIMKMLSVHTSPI